MSRDDWFRRTEWDASAEADFDSRLRRARDKVQPLKIQAALLAESNPVVALRLIDRYFDSGDTLFVAHAYSIQALARRRVGDITGAARSYEAALTREAEFPQVKSNSFVEYPLLVAEHGLSDRYDRALLVLAEHEANLTFPVQHFMWHAARALILEAQGNRTQAEVAAREALDEAKTSASGFRYHQSLGLVGASYGELRERLRGIAPGE